MSLLLFFRMHAVKGVYGIRNQYLTSSKTRKSNIEHQRQSNLQDKYRTTLTHSRASNIQTKRR